MTSRSANPPHRVYCAGPLFNQSERQEMTEIADRLTSAGFLVYLPHRDGMEFRHVLQVLVDKGWPAAEAGHFLHAAIFALDVFQLVEECDSVVWNLNGRTPDEGAVSEAAIAWALGKPIVAYKDDIRTLVSGRDNPLLAGLVEFEAVASCDQVVPALRAKLASSLAPALRMDRLPIPVQTACRQGRELWTVMQQRSAVGNNELLAELVAHLFDTSRSRSVLRCVNEG